MRNTQAATSTLQPGIQHYEDQLYAVISFDLKRWILYDR